MSHIFSKYQASMKVKPNKLSNKGPRGVMVKELDCGIVIREFELQSRYNVHFRTNTLEKGMTPVILPSMG